MTNKELVMKYLKLMRNASEKKERTEILDLIISSEEYLLAFLTIGVVLYVKCPEYATQFTANVTSFTQWDKQ